MATRKIKTSSVTVVDNDAYTISLIREMNRLNSLEGLKEAVSYLQSLCSVESEYLKGCRVPNKGMGSGTITMGWIAALRLSGFPLRDSDVQRVFEFIRKGQHHFNTGTPETLAVKPVQMKKSVDVNDKEASEFIGEVLEAALDEDFGSSLDIAQRIKANPNLKSNSLKTITQWVEDKHTYFSSVIAEKDKEILAAHKHIPLKKLVGRLEVWKTELDKTVKQNKASGVTRKSVSAKPRKVKTPIQQVAKLRLLKTFELTPGDTINGENAVKLIGAEQAWIYNTKTKKITVFRSENNRVGLQCKGTTLNNFDAEASETRTLRKPSEFINEIKGAGKVALRKLTDKLTTKKQDANGRLNEHNIIIRVL